VNFVRWPFMAIDRRIGGRVHPALRLGECGGQHDEMFMTVPAPRSDLGEERDERTLGRPIGGVRERRPAGTVERHRRPIRAITELIARGMILCGGRSHRRCSDEFDCGIRPTHDAGHDNHQREEAGGEKPAVIRDHAKAG